MTVISETAERTTCTPVATMAGLAAPSQGSRELSTWRVEMQPDKLSPAHTIDREQVWMPIAGTFAFTIDGSPVEAAAGQALIVPAGSLRQFQATGGTAQALVCMRAGGVAGIPDGDRTQPLPWAA
jgi:mannose-6-phosphate isomerase-like protein (cupin superfamily)